MKTTLLSAVVAMTGGLYMFASLAMQNGYSRVREKYFGSNDWKGKIQQAKSFEAIPISFEEKFFVEKKRILLNFMGEISGRSLATINFKYCGCTSRCA